MCLNALKFYSHILVASNKYYDRVRGLYTHVNIQFPKLSTITTHTTANKIEEKKHYHLFYLFICSLSNSAHGTTFKLH